MDPSHSVASSVDAARRLFFRLDLTIRGAVLAAVLVAFLGQALPARANEVGLDCGFATSGYGGTYVFVGTAYTTSSDCSLKYLAGTYWTGGIGHNYGGTYTQYDQHEED